MTREKVKQTTYECLGCGRRISKDELEAYSGHCQECHEIEIDELDFEDDDDF